MVTDLHFWAFKVLYIKDNIEIKIANFAIPFSRLRFISSLEIQYSFALGIISK